jgi:hypothetical protein
MHRVNSRIGQKLPVVSLRLRYTRSVGKSPRPFQARPCHAYDVYVSEPPCGLRMDPAHEAGAENRNPMIFHMFAEPKYRNRTSRTIKIWYTVSI